MNTALLDYCLDNEIVSDIGLCGIFALSKATEVPLKKCFYDYKNKFESKNKKWEGGSNFGNLKILAKEYGFYFEDVFVKRERLISFSNRNKDNYEPVIASYRGHIFTLISGLMVDQHSCFLVDGSHAENKFLKSAYKIKRL
jgi:hypothetical protein